jgi:predicted DNA-binding protein
MKEMLEMDNKKSKQINSKQYGTRVNRETAKTLEQLASEQGETVSTTIKNAVHFYLSEYEQKRQKNMARVGIELGRLSNESLDKVFHLFNDLVLAAEMDQKDFVGFFAQLLEEKVNRRSSKK